ncbi:hypothetical protein CP97_14847 [Aurantiacibacter atlanticus]|uniref:Uncharacterized protein n=1 Tax=Aurantiacibacter atlanticus TaxID=1648404 RepID=A0A168M3E9_9SPHN|nr:hypothetical protein CP97_14847 [Aurantiacibacter atlanticus]
MVPTTGREPAAGRRSEAVDIRNLPENIRRYDCLLALYNESITRRLKVVMSVSAES